MHVEKGRGEVRVTDGGERPRAAWPPAELEHRPRGREAALCELHEEPREPKVQRAQNGVEDRKEDLQRPERRVAHIVVAREVHHVEVQVKEREISEDRLEAGSPFDLIITVQAKELDEREGNLERLEVCCEGRRDGEPDKDDEDREDEIRARGPIALLALAKGCLLYTSPSPRD